MALNVRPVVVAAPQSVANNRPVAGPRGGSSASLSGPVEAATAVSGSASGEGSFSAVVSQDNDNFSGRSFTPGQRRDHGDDLPNPHTGIVEFTSQGFAQLIELRDTISSGSDSSGSRDHIKTGGRSIEYASALYEAIIDITAGNKNLLGETVSITL